MQAEEISSAYFHICLYLGHHYNAALQIRGFLAYPLVDLSRFMSILNHVFLFRWFATKMSVVITFALSRCHDENDLSRKIPKNTQRHKKLLSRFVISSYRAGKNSCPLIFNCDKFNNRSTENSSDTNYSQQSFLFNSFTTVDQKVITSI